MESVGPAVQAELNALISTRETFITADTIWLKQYRGQHSMHAPIINRILNYLEVNITI